MGQISMEKKAATEPAPALEKRREKAEIEPAPIARPWRPFDLMRRMLDWDPFEMMEPLRPWREEMVFAPSFTVKETKEAFVIKGDLPGVDPAKLAVNLTQNRLTITGRREDEKKEEGETFYAYERSFGSFTRSFTMPPGIDVDHVDADLKEGVLTITIPKLAEAKAKTVEIKTS